MNIYTSVVAAVIKIILTGKFHLSHLAFFSQILGWRSSFTLKGTRLKPHIKIHL
jgi:hypothetical protein